MPTYPGNVGEQNAGNDGDAVALGAIEGGEHELVVGRLPSRSADTRGAHRSYYLLCQRRGRSAPPGAP
jgi:hypothetical protein